MLSKAEVMQCSHLHEWLTTQLGVKIAPALRVEVENFSLYVAHHSFRITKLHSSRLD